MRPNLDCRWKVPGDFLELQLVEKNTAHALVQADRHIRGNEVRLLQNI